MQCRSPVAGPPPASGWGPSAAGARGGRSGSSKGGGASGVVRSRCGERQVTAGGWWSTASNDRRLTGKEDCLGLGGKKIALRGRGGMARKPICPTPPPSPSLVAVPGGGFGLALPYLLCRGGGGGPTPTYMAQNDPHVALIILTTHMWGKIFS